MSPTSPWAALVLLSVLALAGAQTAYHVANFAQMQTAISSATSVDVILVSGTITGSVTLPANSVTLNIVADPAAASQPTWTATSNTPLVSDVVGWSGSLYISGIALAQSSSNSVPTPLFDFSHSLSGGSVVLSQVLVSMSLCSQYMVSWARPAGGALSYFLVYDSSLTISGGLIDMSSIYSPFNFAITDSIVTFGSALLPCSTGIVIPTGAKLSVPAGGVASFTLRRNTFVMPTSNAATLDANSFLAANAGALTLAITDNTFNYATSAIGNNNVWSFTSLATGVTKAWFARNSFTMFFQGSGALFFILETGTTSMFIFDTNTFDMTNKDAWAPIYDAGSTSQIKYSITNNIWLNTVKTHHPEHVNIKPVASYCATFTGNMATRSPGDEDDIYFGTAGTPPLGNVYVAGNTIPNHPHCTTSASSGKPESSIELDGVTVFVNSPPNFPPPYGSPSLYVALCTLNPSVTYSPSQMGIGTNCPTCAIYVSPTSTTTNSAATDPCNGQFDNNLIAPTAVMDSLAYSSTMNILNNDIPGVSDPVELLYVPTYSARLFQLTPSPSIASGPVAGSMVTESTQSFSLLYTSGTDSFPYFITDMDGGLDATLATIAAPNVVLAIKGGATNLVLPNNPATAADTAHGTLFPSTPIGESSTSIFELCNSGSGTLTISSITSSVPGTFAVSGVPSSVAAMSCSPYTVTFSPSSLASTSAVITVVSSDPANSPWQYQVTGGGALVTWQIVGGTPMQVIPNNDMTPQGSDGTLLPTTSVTSPVATSNFQIQLVGYPSSTLTVTSVSVSATSNAQVGSFAVSAGPMPVSLNPTSDFTIQFTGNTLEGTATATVTVTLSDGSSKNFEVEGVYQTRKLLVKGFAGGSWVTIPNNGATAPSSSFGTTFPQTDIGSTVQQNYEFCNPDSQPLSISSVALGNTADFSLINAPSTVAANTCTTFQIAFHPTVVGTSSSTVTVSSNDQNSMTYSFNIQGVGHTVISEVAFDRETDALDLTSALTAALGTAVDCTSVTITKPATVGWAALEMPANCKVDYTSPLSNYAGVAKFHVSFCGTGGTPCGTATVSVQLYYFVPTNPVPEQVWYMYFDQTFNFTSNLPTGYTVELGLYNVAQTRQYWSAIVPYPEGTPVYAPHKILPGNYILQWTTTNSVVPQANNKVWANTPVKIRVHPPRMT